MARLNRKLNIPLYETTPTPDADGVYDAFEVPDGRNAPPTATASEPPKPSDPLTGDADALRRASWQASRDLMSSLRRSGITREGVSGKKQKQEMSMMHRAFTTTMAMNCVRPLRGGLTAAGVMETAGMATAMMLLSPQLRGVIGPKVGEVYSSVMEKIAHAGEGKALRKEGQAIAQGKSRDDLRRKWLRKLEKYERLERGGLPPFTADSAALMEVGLAESTYHEARVPGADPKVVAAQHKRALNELYTMAAKDGVSKDAISRSMRTVVGLRLPEEPHLAQVFSQTAHGRVVPGQHASKFVDTRSGLGVDRGSFTVRQSMTTDEHREAMVEAFSGGLSAAAVTDSQDVMEAQMYVYAAGLQTGRFPDAAAKTADDGMRKRLLACQSTFQAMAHDGVSPEDAYTVYGEALVSSISIAAARSPEFGDRWFGADGDEWRTRLNAQVDEFCRQSAQSQAEPTDGEFQEATPAAGGESSSPGSTPEEPVQEAARPYEDVETEGDIYNEFPDVAAFTPPHYVQGVNPESVLTEHMSSFMAQDLNVTAHSGHLNDLAGNSWVPRSVYSRAVLIGSPDTTESTDTAMRHRELAVVSMREEMERIGMPSARQDQMFAASYVRGLEKAALVNPAYAQVVKAAAASPSSSWQQVEYSNAIAQSHTAPAGVGYREYLTGCGMDPDVLHETANEEPVTFGQVHQAQSRMGRTLNEAVAVAPARAAEAKVEAQRSRERRAMRGRLNRAYNAEDEGDFTLDTEADGQFSFIDH